MSDWTSGYVVDTPYTIGFYRELSPTWLELCLLVSGHSTLLDQKRARGEPIRYLEIAMGQGLSLNITAATHHGEFWGNDFNPNHALFAQNYAEASKTNARISHDSIHELLNLKDLPNFDVITLHGVWSWITPQDQQDVIKIIYDKLNTGGVVYVSYNTNPGWANSAPLRHLIDIHTRRNEGNARNSVAKFKAGIEFAKNMAEAGAAYFHQSPHAVERLKSLLQQNENYLPHEYSNANWHLLDFEQAHEQFSQAKLSFVTSAGLSDLYDSLGLTPAARQLLANAPNTILRETIHDYLHNTMFRKDIWVKGSTPLTPRQRAEKLRQQSYALLVPPDKAPKSMRFQGGEVGFQPEIYDPVLASLASDNYAPKTPDQILKSLPSRSIDHVNEALLILCGVGAVHPARSASEIKESAEAARNLNRYILAQSSDINGINFMASPVIGSAIMIGRFEQMLLLAESQGAKTPTDWAKQAWAWLKQGNEKLVKDGKELTTDEENLAVLTEMAEEFAKQRLPILRALQVV